MQHTVLVRLADREVEQVESVVRLEIELCLREVEREESCLCLPQRHLHLAELHDFVRLAWIHAQVHSSVNDVFPQSEGDVHDAVLRLLVVDGVVVHRARHARDMRIEACAVCLSHHLLYDDRHLLLVYDIACRRHVCFRILVEDRGIDSLDGVAQHLQSLFGVAERRNHVCRIDAGERLVVRILQERR